MTAGGGAGRAAAAAAAASLTETFAPLGSGAVDSIAPAALRRGALAAGRWRDGDGECAQGWWQVAGLMIGVMRRARRLRQVAGGAC